MGRRAQRATSGRPPTLPSTMPRPPSRRRRIMTQCVFCRIVAKEIPAALVYEDEQTLAFMDAGQVNPGHVLVAVKGHAENLYELNDVQASALLCTAARVARAIRNAYQPQGLSGYQAKGKAARRSGCASTINSGPRHEG